MDFELLKQEARALRINERIGLSEIKRKLSAPCCLASLCIWLKDIPLTHEEAAAMRKRQHALYQKGYGKWGKISKNISEMKKFIEIDSDGCWLWIGPMYDSGYGRVPRAGATQSAHRVMYILTHGSVPDGLQLDHGCHDPRACLGGWNCKHRRCVNPDHMVPSTQKQNKHPTRSCSNTSGIKAAMLARTHCHRGHEYTKENTYIHNGDGPRACKACRALALAKSRRGRQSEIVTLGLIEAIITSANCLMKRNLSRPSIRAAMVNLRADAAINEMLTEC